MSPIPIENIKYAMDVNLPECWLPLEATLSTIGAAMLRDVDHCIGLILVGEPGGRKSTTLELLGSDSPIVRIHRFTPASFVSHDATKKDEQLRKIDLLPQIQHKIMVIPELAPLFGQRYEDLVNDISILTAIMDGKGYWSHSGVQGRRGYENDFRFSIIGATTPLEHRAWQALGKLSSRWLFYRLPEASTAFKSLGQNFSENKGVCKVVVQAFIDDFWKGYGAVRWNRADDEEALGVLLNRSAWTIAKWRGLVPKQEYSGGYNPPVIEAPDRLRETLYALARGHALLWGKHQIDRDDVNFVIYLNETNMPEDRLRVFRALEGASTRHVRIGGTSDDLCKTNISLRAAARAIGCSESKAERVLTELVDLGVLYQDELQRYCRIV